MLRLPLITIFCLSVFCGFSQTSVDFNIFIDRAKDTSRIAASDFLRDINWSELVRLTSAGSGHRTFTEKDSVLTRYHYIKQAGLLEFDITAYKGWVLEYSAGRIDDKQQTQYFNKGLWLMYVNEMLPGLPEKYKLSGAEETDVLKNYYRLLGVNSRDEYGFICEYSAVGMPPEKRQAIVKLIQKNRFDLIRKLVDYPNLQTKLYAIDALIYDDFIAKNSIQKLDILILAKDKKLTKLQKKNKDQVGIENLKAEIQNLRDSMTLLNSNILAESDWKQIFDFRASGQTIRTCGNNGSYKLYSTVVSELLSDRAIMAIPSQYARVMPLKR